MATLSFYGLCGISVQDDIGIKGFTLYLLGHGGNEASDASSQAHDGMHNMGHVMSAGSGRHSTTLVARIKDVDITTNRETNWPAEYVGYDATGHQIGIWRIPVGTEITAETTVDFSGWKTRNQAIDLAAHHPKARSEQKQNKNSYSTVQLGNGQLDSVIGVQPLTLSVNGREFPGHYAHAVKWDSGNGDVTLRIQTCGGETRTISLRPAAEASLTNVAKVPSAAGLEHFQHYYSIIEGAGEPGTLGPGKPADFKKMDVPVYDCVPPVGLP